MAQTIGAGERQAASAPESPAPEAAVPGAAVSEAVAAAQTTNGDLQPSEPAVEREPETV
jgi:hypothetical protein